MIDKLQNAASIKPDSFLFSRKKLIDEHHLVFTHALFPQVIIRRPSK